MGGLAGALSVACVAAGCRVREDAISTPVTPEQYPAPKSASATSSTALPVRRRRSSQLVDNTSSTAPADVDAADTADAADVANSTPQPTVVAPATPFVAPALPPTVKTAVLKPSAGDKKARRTSKHQEHRLPPVVKLPAIDYSIFDHTKLPHVVPSSAVLPVNPARPSAWSARARTREEPNAGALPGANEYIAWETQPSRCSTGRTQPGAVAVKNAKPQAVAEEAAQVGAEKTVFGGEAARRLGEKKRVVAEKAAEEVAASASKREKAALAVMQAALTAHEAAMRARAAEVRALHSLAESLLFSYHMGGCVEGIMRD